MVRTTSIMLPIGTKCPEFELEMVDGIDLHPEDVFKGNDRVSSKALSNKPLFLMIICAHCPFVKHVEQCLADLYHSYGQKIQFLGISSNSVITHPQDCEENLSKQANSLGWRFPYLLDHDQSLAKKLQAACTPDFYIFSPSSDGDQILRYRGQLDESRPGNQFPVTGKDIRLAFDALLIGKDISNDQKPSIGCNIKWHPGNEPSWFSSTQ